MRHAVHPVSRPVLFRDRVAGFELLVPSTAAARHTAEWEDGNTYPVVDVDISSASHPFYTGASRAVDIAGRLQRFERRYGSTAHTRR
ncbi:type B 50S ribosomal protein L31 [Streptomyces rubrogriseus]|uniref:50S ribosomal protein L31 n=1 Tax=Streptomyces rubrogriseus TaxID=194673 RepID=A0A6G3TBE6_9ACTN|nr:type B 50S ribosomal protein L31 [Streptomyces rubrogriseus]NEC33866.1 type B 50S ribosomal protein L31 [Streptomyces rubrogriseus]